MSKKTIIAFIIILFYLDATAQQAAVRLKEIASTLNAGVGVWALVLETGDTISFRAERKYPMQSVYKLPIIKHYGYNNIHYESKKGRDFSQVSKKLGPAW